MIRAASVVRSGEFDRSRVIDCVRLDSDDRHRRRIVLTGEGGTAFLLDLPHATALHEGDGLVLDDGTVVAVVGVPEPLAEIGAPTPLDIVRLAWHLGNRHADVQLVGGKLRIRRDHVLEDMARRLGATVTPLEAPFDPEADAHGHSHDRGPDHSHDHPHDHGPHRHDP